MTTQKTIFVSIGLDEPRTNNPHPEIDKVITLECLRGIFAAAAHDKHRLVLRDHPAVTALAEAFMGADNRDLITVSESTMAETIAANHKPDIVFYAAGQDDVIADYTAFTARPGILNTLLSGTGGATATLAARNRQNDDDFGFSHLHRALAKLRPAP